MSRDAADMAKTGNDNSGDPQYEEEEEERRPPAEDPETPGLRDDRDDSDEDGPVPPPEDEDPGPGDGGMFVGDAHNLGIEDDLLDAFVLAIEDIDVA